jgi:hypothetical protein
LYFDSIHWFDHLKLNGTFSSTSVVSTALGCGRPVRLRGGARIPP